MYIIIDESGILRPAGVTTIAAIYTDSYEALLALNNAVLEVEDDLRIYPFHWVHANWRVRQKFIQALAKAAFSAKVAMANNPVRIETFMEDALTHLLIEKDIEKIILDGSKPKSYARKLHKVLRDKGITVKRLIMVDDHRYPAVRVADAIAGLVRTSTEKPTSPAPQIQRIIQARIKLVLTIK